MSTPLFDCIVDHALVQAFLNDTLLWLIHILDFLAVNALLKNATYLAIDRVDWYLGDRLATKMLKLDNLPPKIYTYRWMIYMCSHMKCASFEVIFTFRLH